MSHKILRGLRDIFYAWHLGFDYCVTLNECDFSFKRNFFCIFSEILTYKFTFI